MRQEQLQDRPGERFRALDVPLLAQWPDGRREALLFVIEEESDRLAALIKDLLEISRIESGRVNETNDAGITKFPPERSTASKMRCATSSEITCL